MQQQSNYFVVFPMRLLDDVNYRQAILFGLVTSMSSKTGYCYASNQTLADILKCHKDTLKNDLRVLTDLGYIRREVDRDEQQVVVQRRIYLTEYAPKGRGQMTPEGMVSITTEPVGSNATINSHNEIVIKDKYNEIVKTFEDLWITYTKVGVKKKALSAWKRLTKEQRKLAQLHVPVYIEHHKKNQKQRYIPHMSTYLNQERWADNLPYDVDTNVDWG